MRSVVAVCAALLACDAGTAGEGPAVDRVGVRATATLESLELGSVDGGVDPTEITGAIIRHVGDAGPVAGEATLTATLEGVDLYATTTHCVYTRGYPLHLIAEASCAQLAQDQGQWKRSRGEAVAVAACSGTSGRGRAYASRAIDHEQPWTIDANAASDLLGKLLVLRDPYSDQPIACGPIVRAPDLQPAEGEGGEPVAVELQAAVAGLCFLKQPDAPAECSDPGPAVECGRTHCDLDRCVRACPEHLACLATDPDPCEAAFSCVTETECSTCRSATLSCMLGFCFDELACAPPPTPGGPCTALRKCCESQGDFEEPCLGLVEQLERLSGDRSCLGTINDWDWNQALPVPCTYEL